MSANVSVDEKKAKALMEQSCVHKFKWLQTRCRRDTSGYGSYYRVDEFYCTKCLLLRQVDRTLHETSGGIKQGPPDWYTL